MIQYIDKNALVAEIKRRKELVSDPILSGNDLMIGERNAYFNLLPFIDTLEVKEVDLENGMVCKVDWYDGFLLDYTQEQQDELLEKIGANVGDKIRVILIKE